jgi:hypothetical protein
VQYTQTEFLEIMQKYNAMDRKTITTNLCIVYKILGIKNKTVMEDFKYSPYKINSWTALSSPNVPTFEDALALAVKYNFDIKDLIKE